MQQSQGRRLARLLIWDMASSFACHPTLTFIAIVRLVPCFTIDYRLTRSDRISGTVDTV